VRRREIITLLGGAAAWPLAARAQRPAMPVIGFLHSGSADRYVHVVTAFRHGLKQSGYVEGQNVAIEYRWADEEIERLSELASDLIRREVAVLVAGGGAPTALAAHAATSTIPIVLAFGSDPVRLGLVASLSRPGGNITGATFRTTELMAKRLDLLHELVPQATTIAYLYRSSAQPNVATQDMLDDLLAAARALGRQVALAEAHSEGDFEPAFANVVERGAGALVVGASSLFDGNRDKLVALAARHHMPAIYQAREYVPEGGLMSYGANNRDAFRVAGLYVGQILKGAKPANLPFDESARFELTINLKTAKALGIEVPLSLLIRADELID
jgi:putative ABC transport system substrate-binding protein